MSFHLGFIIESTVAVLLAISIGYSIAVDKKLRKLRLGEDELRKTIQDLGGATEKAERAVATLRQALEDSDTELAGQIRIADRRVQELQMQIRAGDDILHRIGRIVGVGEGKLAA